MLFLVELFLLAYCLLSAITTPSDQVRTLPKAAWLVVIVLVPIAGPVAWLLAGRPRTGGPSGTGTRPAPGPNRPVAPDDDEEFLRQLRRRAEEQRRRGEEKRRAGED